MKDLGTLNPRQVSEQEVAQYRLREAARAIVVDDKGDIALLHVSRDGYHKLPGGGLDPNEDRLIALQRECMEEIGCNIEVIGEVGFTTECWREDEEKQISYCYLAKVVGPKGVATLTESEKERGFETVWLPFQDAVNALQNRTSTHWEGDYIVPRELFFFEGVKDSFPMKKALLLPMNTKGEIFLQDRRGHKKPDWGFFGGGIEEGETPLQALIRESEEELCIHLTEADVRYVGISVTNWDGSLNIRHMYTYPTDQAEFDVREGVGGSWMTLEEAKKCMDPKDRLDEVFRLPQIL